MTISQAQKFQGNFHKIVKICYHAFSDEIVSCAYTKKTTWVLRLFI